MRLGPLFPVSVMLLSGQVAQAQPPDTLKTSYDANQTVAFC